MKSYIDESSGSFILRSYDYSQNHCSSEWIVSGCSIHVGRPTSEEKMTFALPRVTNITLNGNGDLKLKGGYDYLSLYIDGGISPIPNLQPNEVLSFHPHDLPIAEAIIKRVSNYNE